MPDPIAFTDATPRFKLPFLFAGQTQKEFFVNEAHALADMLVHTAVLGEQAEPPTDATEGDIWLVGPGASDEWMGREGSLAGRQAGIWKFVPPLEGMRMFDRSTGQFAIYAGGWTRPDTPITPDTGQTVDSELRTAFAQLIEALRIAGIFPVA